MVLALLIVAFIFLLVAAVVSAINRSLVSALGWGGLAAWVASGLVGKV